MNKQIRVAVIYITLHLHLSLYYVEVEIPQQNTITIVHSWYDIIVWYDILFNKISTFGDIWYQSDISLQSNGITLAISCNFFLIIQQLTVINCQKIPYFLSTYISYLHFCLSYLHRQIFTFNCYNYVKLHLFAEMLPPIKQPVQLQPKLVLVTELLACSELGGSSGTVFRLSRFKVNLLN